LTFGKGLTAVNREETIALIKEWLAAKKVTLWMNWTITEEKGAQAAAEWLYETMDSVVAFSEQKAHPHA
jgi:hypothetical protein